VKNILKIVLVMLLVVVLLSACGPMITSGTVKDKSFEPEHNTIVMMPVTSGKITTLRPMLIHRSDSWYLVLVDEDGDEETISVDQNSFDSVNVGDYYQIPENN